jgi:hypothetical protein
MDEMVILSMLLCVGIAAIGLRMKVWPVTFVSSIGWVIIAMQVYQTYGNMLVLALMIMVALAQVFMIKSED